MNGNKEGLVGMILAIVAGVLTIIGGIFTKIGQSRTIERTAAKETRRFLEEQLDAHQATDQEEKEEES